MKTTNSVRYTVDRRVGEFLVLVGEQGAPIDVPAKAMAPDCRRAGTVLDAPVGGSGQPQWQRAKRNRREEERRLSEAAAKLERQRGRESGGDVRV